MAPRKARMGKIGLEKGVSYVSNRRAPREEGVPKRGKKVNTR